MGLFKLRLIDEFQKLIDDKQLIVSTVQNGKVDDSYKIRLVNLTTGEMINFYIETDGPVRDIEHNRVVSLDCIDERSTYGRGYSRRLGEITVQYDDADGQPQQVSILGR